MPVSEGRCEEHTQELGFCGSRTHRLVCEMPRPLTWGEGLQLEGPCSWAVQYPPHQLRAEPLKFGQRAAKALNFSFPFIVTQCPYYQVDTRVSEFPELTQAAVALKSTLTLKPVHFLLKMKGKLPLSVQMQMSKGNNILLLNAFVRKLLSMSKTTWVCESTFPTTSFMKSRYRSNTFEDNLVSESIRTAAAG